MRKDVTVLALMKKEGKIIPQTLVWEDGRKFEIDKVLDVRPAASTKGGGMGLRYLCRIKGKERYLFLDKYIWFVEL